MNLAAQLGILVAICLAGEGIAAMIPISFPASVISLLLLIVLLFTGAIKEHQISKPADFFSANIGIFFVPACVGFMNYFAQVKQYLFALIFICLITTPIVYAATAFSVSFVRHLGQRKQGQKNA